MLFTFQIELAAYDPRQNQRLMGTGQMTAAAGWSS